MNEFKDWLEWLTGSQTAEPTYPALDSVPVDEARLTLDQVFDEFMQIAERWNDKHAPIEDDEDNPFLDLAEEVLKRKLEEDPPPVRATSITTGTGKTERVIAMLARYILARWAAGDRRSWLYLVPTIWLGEHIDDKFRARGLTVKVYRGMTRPDPSPANMKLPKDKQEQMCLAPEKRALAQSLHKSISSSCCKHKKERCEFHPEGSGRRNCGYQTQTLGEQPHIWIAAHNMLFHPQKAFGDIGGIIIDEGFAIKSGVYGVGKKKDDEIPGMPVDDIAADGDACPWRKNLIEVLRAHPLGGLRRERLLTMKTSLVDEYGRPAPTSAVLKFDNDAEWDVVNSLKLTPEMTPAQIKEIGESEQAAKCRRARWMAGTYRALRDMLDAEIEVSGRLTLATNKEGKLVLQRRGIHKVVESRQVPTFLMDATLPDAPVLRVFFPQLRDEDITRVNVAMPEHVNVTQVLSAPTSDSKLWGRGNTAKGEHREEVKRFILQWWLEDDRRSMLMICQKKYEKWLRDNLPKEIVVPPKSKRELQWDEKVIAIEHYNDVSGLDIYRNVSSILLIGRIQPSPQDVQALAGALLGTEPTVMFKPRQPDGTPGEWFKPPVRRAIRMADATPGRVVECDRHPDVMCEAVRLLQCEGELIQAFGRARAVNRTAANPLRAGILNDVVLDLTMNRVSDWVAPIELAEPLALDGLVPTAPGDLAKGWPNIWPTADTAKWTLKKLQAAARRGGKGFQSGISSIYLLLEIPLRNTPDTASLSSARGGSGLQDIPSSIAVAQYQARRGRGQRFRELLFDLRVLSHPGAKLVEKIGEAYHAFAHKLFRRDLQPMAGNGGLDVLDHLVRILRKARYTLSADVKQQPTYIGTGRAGRFTLSKDPQALVAHDGKPGGIITPHLDAYSELPTELRLRALGLHDTNRNTLH